MSLADMMAKQAEELMGISIFISVIMLLVFSFMAIIAFNEIASKRHDKSAIMNLVDISFEPTAAVKFDELYKFMDSNFNEIIAFGDDLMKFKTPEVGGQRGNESLLFESLRRASCAIDAKLTSLTNRMADIGIVSTASGVGVQSRHALVKGFSEKYIGLYKV